MKIQSLFFKHLLLLAAIIALTGCFEKGIRDQYQPDEKDIALVTPYPSLEEMIGVSPCIFTGTVVGIRYGKHKSSFYPYTFVTFKEIRFIKNTNQVSLDKGGTFEISYIGGISDDNTILKVSAMPHFNMGDRYLIFLRGGGWKLSPIPGGDKGYFILSGKAGSDPLLLDPSEIPISRFENGYRILSTKKTDETGKKDRLEDFRTEDISREEAIKLGIATKKTIDTVAVIKLETELMEKEMELDDKDTIKEIDQVNNVVNRWSEIMRLSELVEEIERSAKESQVKYENFERLYLNPVPFKGRGEIKRISPSESK